VFKGLSNFICFGIANSFASAGFTWWGAWAQAWWGAPCADLWVGDD